MSVYDEGVVNPVLGGADSLLSFVHKFKLSDLYEGPFTAEMLQLAIQQKAYNAGFEFSGDGLPSIVPEVSITYAGIANALNYVYSNGVFGKSIKLRPEIIAEIYADELVDRSVVQLFSLLEAVLAAGVHNSLEKKDDFETNPIPFDNWS